MLAAHEEADVGEEIAHCLPEIMRFAQKAQQLGITTCVMMQRFPFKNSTPRQLIHSCSKYNESVMLILMSKHCHAVMTFVMTAICHHMRLPPCKIHAAT